MVKSLSLELAASNIEINAIAPDYIKTRPISHPS
jgi:NAD(P)-dependent dehydrogenase (short-subunit alcohol dehydrogenase family)